MNEKEFKHMCGVVRDYGVNIEIIGGNIINKIMCTYAIREVYIEYQLYVSINLSAYAVLFGDIGIWIRIESENVGVLDPRGNNRVLGEYSDYDCIIMFFDWYVAIQCLPKTGGVSYAFDIKIDTGDICVRTYRNV